MKYLNDQQSQQLRLADTADLRPNSNEVLIATQASGINRADLLQLDGHYPPPVGASDIIGLEVAGQVLSAPPGCNFQVGDKVMALLSGGGYAEQVCVDVGSVMPMPANLSYVQAAAIPEAFITAYQALFTLGRLHEKIAQNGEPPVRVLIHAGASGVGTAAIQLANLSGAQVFSLYYGLSSAVYVRSSARKNSAKWRAPRASTHSRWGKRGRHRGNSIGKFKWRASIYHGKLSAKTRRG